MDRFGIDPVAQMPRTKYVGLIGENMPVGRLHSFFLFLVIEQQFKLQIVI